MVSTGFAEFQDFSNNPHITLTPWHRRESEEWEELREPHDTIRGGSAESRPASRSRKLTSLSSKEFRACVWMSACRDSAVGQPGLLGTPMFSRPAIFLRGQLYSEKEKKKKGMPTGEWSWMPPDDVTAPPLSHTGVPRRREARS